MSKELVEAIEEVLSAVGDYLPPDGISKDDFINRVISATDNPDFNNYWRSISRTSEVLEWDGSEVRAPTGDLYRVIRLSSIVWVTEKNGTAMFGWKDNADDAKIVALEDFRSVASKAHKVGTETTLD